MKQAIKQTYKLLHIITFIIVIGLLIITIHFVTKAIVLSGFKNQFSNTIFDNKILLVFGNGMGEREQTYRFKIAADRLSVDLRVVSNQASVLQALYIKDPVSLAADIMQPDIVLIIERNIRPISNFANYLVLDQSEDAYINKRFGQVKFFDEKLLNLAGLLPTFPNLAIVENIFKNANKSFNGFVWYPTVYQTAYSPQQPRRVFYPGGKLQDITRGSLKYKTIFSILDNTGYMEIYGIKSKWKHTPKSFRGFIPADGVTLLQKQNQAGISLILHDAEHLYGDVPSSRIFEAAAANTVIISDRHKFIIDNFGDNVLYIDVEENAESIAQQIDSHVRWIYSNPDAAKGMALNCHKIFIDNFTLEKQLLHLIDLNLQRVGNDKTR